MTKPELSIELVPKTCWYSNVRSEVDEDRWDLIRRAVYRKARYRCEVCGGKGSNHPVECHERWHYDGHHKIQTLLGMIALCPACHEVKHIGLAQSRGRLPQAIEHLMEVNDWTDDEAITYTREVADTWRERSQYEWELNIDVLDQDYPVP